MRYCALCHAWQGRRRSGERISGVATKTEDVRTIVGSHQTSEGNAVDLALSHGAARGDRDDPHDETQGRRVSSEKARAFQWSISRLAQPESSNLPKLKT